jgi:GYF domain 2
MDWYYAHQGAQVGPIASGPFEELVRAGRVTPGTLVWHEGMAQWQPYSTAALSVSIISPQPGPGQATCIECGKTFSQSEMLSYEKSWICAGCKPIFFQRVKEGAAPPAAMMLWRSDRILVMSQNESLPDRCVKCNRPVNGQRLARKLYWYPLYIYLLVLLTGLLGAIVALIVRKRARVKIGICNTHLLQRRIALAIGWMGSLAGIGLLIGGVKYGRASLILIGLFLFLGALIYGVAKAPVVSANRIDPKYVWLKGVCRQYLDTLPEWKDTA